jgi:hypothetical protein
MSAASDFLGDMTRGAALGSALGPVGAGVGAAAAVVADIADATGVTRWLGLDGTRTAVTAAVQAVTGSTDPTVQGTALMDPEAAMKLRVAFATIATNAQTAWDAARMADTAGARAQTLDLARLGSPLAWGAAVVSTIVMCVWAYATVAHVALGDGELRLLDAALVLTLGYWLGSSAGSARKSDTIARQLAPQP